MRHDQMAFGLYTALIQIHKLQSVPVSKLKQMTWPELQIMQFKHGTDAVTEIVQFAEVTRSPNEEYSRLLQKYGTIVRDLFPGINPQMERFAPEGSARIALDPKPEEPEFAEAEDAAPEAPEASPAAPADTLPTATPDMPPGPDAPPADPFNDIPKNLRRGGKAA